ncbi:MAG: hypothetical protein IKB67_03880 [Clostridia bacterium]|nr:hypothetical protein [Clostridia bacterium]
MRKYIFPRKVITEKSGNIPLTNTKRTLCSNERINVVNELLIEILANQEDGDNATT